MTCPMPGCIIEGDHPVTDHAPVPMEPDPRLVAALAAALHLTAPHNHNLGEGMARAICQIASAHNRRAAAILDTLNDAGWQLWPHGTALVDTLARDAKIISALRAAPLDVERLTKAINNVEWVRGETWKPPTHWFEAYARNIAREYVAIAAAKETP